MKQDYLFASGRARTSSAPSASSALFTHHRPLPGSFRYEAGKFAGRYRGQIVAVASNLMLLTKATLVHADSIFTPAQTAMKCIVTEASTGGGVTAIFTNLPFIMFTSLELIIFSYMIYTVVQAVSAYGQGQEVTHLVQQPVVTFSAMILIFVFESVIFGGATGCT